MPGAGNSSLGLSLETGIFRDRSVMVTVAATAGMASAGVTAPETMATASEAVPTATTKTVASTAKAR